MRTLFSLTLLVAAAGSGFAQMSITDALRKGIIEEEVNKNLPAAIKQYSAVVQRFDADRKLYAPKGEASAAVRESYRKLLAMQSDYADKNYQAQLMRYKLGSGVQIDIVRASRAGIEAKLRLAAFDAGITGSSGFPAGGGFSGTPETRLGTATALYRMAECYRKTGKNEQANAAYGRLISEFPEQGELAIQSRGKLPVGSSVPSSPQQEAFARIGELLTQYAEITKQYLNYCTRQLDLGAISELDLYIPRLELAEAESRLAAWKAGEFDLALRPITLSMTAGQEPQPPTLWDAKYAQLQSLLDDAIKKNKNEHAQEIRQLLKIMQDQADVVRNADGQRIREEIKQLQQQVEAIQAAPGASTGHWPRAVIDIRADIIRVEQQLKQTSGQSKADEYQRRRLTLQLTQLKGELEVAQK